MLARRYDVGQEFKFPLKKINIWQEKWERFSSMDYYQGTRVQHRKGLKKGNKTKSFTEARSNIG